MSEPNKRWCDSCNRLVELGPFATDEVDARCPSCGAGLERTGERPNEDDEEGPPRAPWHFKVLVFGTVGYLIYRLIWFIQWLTHHG